MTIRKKLYTIGIRSHGRDPSARREPWREGQKRGPISMSKLKLFVLFSIACGQVFGQGERATISGTVTDSTGAVVPQVRVTVRNERTNIVNKAESNSTGLYVVPAL